MSFGGSTGSEREGLEKKCLWFCAGCGAEPIEVQDRSKWRSSARLSFGVMRLLWRSPASRAAVLQQPGTGPWMTLTFIMVKRH